MYKIIIIEGLPGVGKTTILNNIKNRFIENVNVVNEIIYKNNNDITQEKFLINDDMKINLFKDGVIFIDRGPISTLSYNEMKNKLIGNSEYKKVLNYFNNNYKDFYLLPNVYTVYIKTKRRNLIHVDSNNLYKSFEKQEILERITLKNIRKYCKNYQVLEYKQKDLENFVNKIIEKYI